MRASANNTFRLEDKKFTFRMMLSLLCGLVVAGLLTWFMYGLIQFSEKKMDESVRIHILDFVRLKRNESSARKERKLERPSADKAPPAPAAPDLSDSANSLNTIGISELPANSDMDFIGDGFGFGAGEGEFLPIVKVAPIYPLSAASRGLEGDCMVEYTVTTSGTTKDIFVVDEVCSHAVFRRPSIEAAKRFKYKPRIINGEAIEVRRVRNRFVYILAEKDGRADD